MADEIVFLFREPEDIKPLEALSASQANKYAGCPQKWAFSRADRTPLPPEDRVYMDAGTAAHLAIEHLYMLAPSDRTPEVLDQIVTEILERDETAAALADRTQYDQIVRDNCTGLFSTETPTAIEVLGNELCIDGTVVAGVPVRGFIDRVDVLTDGTLGVRDYKTGKPKPQFRDQRTDYYEQIRLYAAAVYTITGKMVSSGQLIHPAHRTILEIEVSPPQLEQSMSGFAAIWSEISTVAFTDRPLDSFDANTGILCGWCEYAPICPAGRAWVENCANDPKYQSWAAKPHNVGKTMPAQDALAVPVRIEPVASDEGASPENETGT